MISEIYKNRELYYNMMKDFLNKKIYAIAFKGQYWKQRDIDIDENTRNGYSNHYKNKIKNLIKNEKIFKENFFNILYEEAWADNCLNILKEYEQGAKELGIKGELFFMGIWNFIDEYIREYVPGNSVYFDSEMDVDENTLREKIQAVFDVLERNKDRWMIEKHKLEQEQSKDDEGHKV